MSVRPKTLLYKSILLAMAFSLLGVNLTLAASGDLDPTFSGDGWVSTDFNRHFNGANDIAIQPDGKIVAAGSNTVNDANLNFALVRYTPEGRLDRTFGSNGRVQTNFGGRDGASGVALQGNGKIVVAGSTCDEFLQSCNTALARYTPAGTLDPTFGTAGKVVTRFGTADNGARDVALQPDGKIVVCGYARFPNGNQLVVYRYLRNGSLDPTFSGDGKVRIPIRHSSASALAIQPGDGKIVVVGSAFDELTSNDILVVRLTLDGALDPTFSGDGIQRTSFSYLGLEGWDVVPYALAIQPNGKIVVVGETMLVDEEWDESDVFVVRYNSNGRLDTTFSGDGTFIWDFAGLNESERATGVVVQPDGKLVLALYFLASNDIVLVRLKPNGLFDPSFHGEGFVSISLRSPWLATLARQSSDGKYVIGGGVFGDNSTGWDFLVARVLP
jgi:uncharacterized delta-60 repeat protein